MGSEAFDHMHVEMTDHIRSFGRVEVHERAGRRRRWTGEQKGRIVAETRKPPGAAAWRDAELTAQAAVLRTSLVTVLAAQHDVFGGSYGAGAPPSVD